MNRSLRTATLISALLLSAGAMAQTGGGSPTQNMDQHTETGVSGSDSSMQSTTPAKKTHKKAKTKKAKSHTNSTSTDPMPDPNVPNQGTGAK
ncbi:MAG TPA: hypothetical protein VGO72_03055 [Herminiimonas sp.]|nr:hypothetical protein [Herminiimonas sp.]